MGACRFLHWSPLDDVIKICVPEKYCFTKKHLGGTCIAEMGEMGTILRWRLGWEKLLFPCSCLSVISESILQENSNYYSQGEGTDNSSIQVTWCKYTGAKPRCEVGGGVKSGVCEGRRSTSLMYGFGALLFKEFRTFNIIVCVCIC